MLEKGELTCFGEIHDMPDEGLVIQLTLTGDKGSETTGLYLTKDQRYWHKVVFEDGSQGFIFGNENWAKRFQARSTATEKSPGDQSESPAQAE